MDRGRLGVLMLETQFPRPPGDIGSAESFPFPVSFRTIPGASAKAAVRGDPEAFFLDFLAAAKAMVADGATAIATSCGFLSVYQHRLIAALECPVFTSSLMFFDSVQADFGRVGIVTIDADALSEPHLAAATIPADTPIVGLPREGHLATTIFEDRLILDLAAAEREMVVAADTLVRNHPDLSAILLECTNMGPYAPALRRATGLPVFGIVDLIINEMADA